jgi:5-methylcytosine-specific restriction endonuclease McrA
MEKTCKWCGSSNNQRKMFCKKSCYQKYWAFKRKARLILKKGGKCSRCGYAANITALNFHHLDPATKENKLSTSILRKKTWEWCLDEAEKCIILCSNCHAEHHNPFFDNWELI